MKVQVRKESFVDHDGQLKQFKYVCVVDDQGIATPSAQTALDRIRNLDPQQLEQVVQDELRQLLNCNL
jgi:hypothetical protein